MPRPATLSRVLLAAGVGSVIAGAGMGCGAILGIEELSGTGNAGGAGGSGGAGGQPLSCEPGASCYTGPPGTEGVGVCAPGTCGANGDTCEGETTPYVEDCATIRFDENCDERPACSGDGAISIAAHGPDAQDSAFVAVDFAGNVYVAGTFSGSFAFPGGPQLESAGLEDVFVAKLDAELKHVWSKSFGDPGTQEVTGVAADGGAVVVTGTFAGAIDLGGGAHTANGINAGFVTSFSPAGDHQWSLFVDGSGDDRVADVALDANSDIYVVGSYNAELSIQPLRPLSTAVNVNGLLLKIDSGGVPEWAQDFGNDSSSMVVPKRVAARLDGEEVYVAGEFSAPFVLGGSTLEHQGPGADDVFVARFSGTSAGDATWAGSFGGPDEDVVKSIAPDFGAFLVAFEYRSAVVLGGQPVTVAPADSEADVLVVRLEPDGAGAAWYEDLAGVGPDTAGGVAIDGTGHWVLAGSYANQIGSWKAASGPGDVYIAKYEPDQSGVWYYNIGGDPGEWETALDVAIDPLGNILVVGFYDGHLTDLNPAVSEANQQGVPRDLFVLKRFP